MGPVSGPELCAAVADAGGVGMLAATWLPPALLTRSVEAVRARTDGTFGANFVLEFDVHAGLLQAIELGIPVISTFWGDPTEAARLVSPSSALHLHTVGSVEDAKTAEQAGVDVLVAQGVEAGGHVYGTQPLHRLLADIVAACELPVIAAGGIATADDVAAVVRLGACGVWVGTRFVVASEARAHPAYQRAIVDAGPDATVWTADCFDSSWKDAPHRVLRNATVETYLRDGVRAGRDPIAATPNGAPVPRYDDRPPVSGMTGEIGEMALYAGCGAERITGVQPAADIVADLARGLVIADA